MELLPKGPAPRDDLRPQQEGRFELPKAGTRLAAIRLFVYVATLRTPYDPLRDRAASSRRPRAAATNTGAHAVAHLAERGTKKRARSIIAEAASRDWGGLLIAAIYLVFISLLRSRPRSTGRRCCGGPAIMIMHPVNLRVGVPGMGGIGGVPDITGTENAPLSIGLRGHRLKTARARPIALGARLIG